MYTRTSGARCAPYPKQNNSHKRHENIIIQNVQKEETNALQNILTGQSPIHITEQFNPFKAMCVNIVEHKGFVNYIVRNTSSYLTQALNGSSSEQ
jgi:hypothetical protein